MHPSPSGDPLPKSGEVGRLIILQVVADQSGRAAAPAPTRPPRRPCSPFISSCTRKEPSLLAKTPPRPPSRATRAWSHLSQVVRHEGQSLQRQPPPDLPHVHGGGEEREQLLAPSGRWTGVTSPERAAKMRIAAK